MANAVADELGRRHEPSHEFMKPGCLVGVYDMNILVGDAFGGTSLQTAEWHGETWAGSRRGGSVPLVECVAEPFMVVVISVEYVAVSNERSRGVTHCDNSDVNRLASCGLHHCAFVKSRQRIVTVPWSRGVTTLCVSSGTCSSVRFSVKTVTWKKRSCGRSIPRFREILPLARPCCSGEETDAPNVAPGAAGGGNVGRRVVISFSMNYFFWQRNVADGRGGVVTLG